MKKAREEYQQGLNLSKKNKVLHNIRYLTLFCKKNRIAVIVFLLLFTRIFINSLPDKRDKSMDYLYSFGFITRPINKTLPERLSRIKNKNGWSARKTGIFVGPTEVRPTTTPVAAAASVPSSFTSTYAL